MDVIINVVCWCWEILVVFIEVFFCDEEFVVDSLYMGLYFLKFVKLYVFGENFVKVLEYCICVVKFYE